MPAALQAVRRFRIRELVPILKADPQHSNVRPQLRNPFLPFKNPESGRWAPAKYSLRRQAELVKHARASGTLHLLPSGPKLSLKELASASAVSASAPASEIDTTTVESSASASSAVAEIEAEAKVAPWWSTAVKWEGEHKEKEVKGADVGNRLYAGRKRMFKGHKWERTSEARERERKMLMKDMKARIERFRTTYKRKTPSPISPARPVSYSKLPF